MEAEEILDRIRLELQDIPDEEMTVVERNIWYLISDEVYEPTEPN